MKKAMLFDLDDTLYDTGQYYRGSFREIARYCSKAAEVSERKVYSALISIWKSKTSMYGYLFSDVLKLFNISLDTNKLVHIFNTYSGDLTPYQDTIKLLLELQKHRYKIGIISDGSAARQNRKIRALGLTKFINATVWTNSHRFSKLSERPFLIALRKLNCEAENSWFIANNPKLDFMGAKKAGLRTVRLVRGEFASMPTNEYITHEIRTLTELTKLI